MRKPHIATSLLVIVLFVPCAHAQKGNWQAVEKILPGMPISVVNQQRDRLMCYFEHATDDQLICRTLPRSSGFPFPTPVERYNALFERRDVREVRLEHAAGTNALIGGGIGGAVGAALVARLDEGAGPKGGAIGFASMVGALLGAVVGIDRPLFHRKTIYKR